ncbi:MAG: hypothetical protein Q8Q40_05285 [Methylococcaceae bacterium]|nr:hypothetical protein [Methylococcaceae bacterium]MDP3903367.1 hypothetical protein [Methylococcaceae bacterium]
MQNTKQNSANSAATSTQKAYFFGSGIASLAGAAFHIFEELKVTGGSLDGAGTPEQG